MNDSRTELELTAIRERLTAIENRLKRLVVVAQAELDRSQNEEGAETRNQALCYAASVMDGAFEIEGITTEQLAEMTIRLAQIFEMWLATGATNVVRGD